MVHGFNSHRKTSLIWKLKRTIRKKKIEKSEISMKKQQSQFLNRKRPLYVSLEYARFSEQSNKNGSVCAIDNTAIAG